MDYESGMQKNLSDYMHGGETIRKNWGWFVALGLLMVILGGIAIGYPLASTVAISLILGWVLLIAGIVQIIHAFTARKWSAFGLFLLTGLLYMVVGIVMFRNPIVSIVTLTLLLAVLFIVEGLAKFFMSLDMRGTPNWGWIMFNGIISLILGILILSGWPATSAWVLGLLVGIDLIVGGMTIAGLALTAHSVERRMEQGMAAA